MYILMYYHKSFVEGLITMYNMDPFYTICTVIGWVLEVVIPIFVIIAILRFPGK